MAAVLLDEEGVSSKGGARLFPSMRAFREALRKNEREEEEYDAMTALLRPPRPGHSTSRDEWEESPPQAAEVM